jgi:hypothetical protein
MKKNVAAVIVAVFFEFKHAVRFLCVKMQAANVGFRPFNVKIDYFPVRAVLDGAAFQLLYAFIEAGYFILNPFAPLSVFHSVLLDLFIKAFILIDRLVLRGAVAAHHPHYGVRIYSPGSGKKYRNIIV